MVYLMKLNPHIAIIRQLVADSNAIVKRDGQAENREHIGGQMDGRTNGQKDRQTESWTDGQTDNITKTTITKYISAITDPIWTKLKQQQQKQQQQPQTQKQKQQELSWIVTKLQLIQL